jgi:hypothetical protein
MTHRLADFADLPPDVQAALDIPGHALGWRGVTYTQLSIARHYGGTTVNGKRFTYFPGTDELIRDDLLKAIVAHKRQQGVAEAALDRMAENARQIGLEFE